MRKLKTHSAIYCIKSWENCLYDIEIENELSSNLQY